MSKAVFIGVAPMLCVAMIVRASLALAAGGATLAWAGVLVANVVLPIVLAIILSRRFARTSANLPTALFVAGGGVLAAAVGGVLSADLQPVAFALTGLVATSAYVFWYSRLDRSQSRLRVGEPLPAFTILDADGQPFDEVRLRQSAHLLLFFRGNWCPLCMAQIKEVAAQYREIAARGARIVLISPQPPGHTQALAKRFDVPFIFLVDTEFKAAKALGLFHAKGLPMGFQALGYDSDTVLPTVILTDADGIVRHLDQTDNYRSRPEPETFLRALAEI